MQNELMMQKIYSVIGRASTILLITHANPDADAVSSVYSFTQQLDQLGKAYDIFFTEPLPTHLENLRLHQPFQTNPDLVVSKNYSLIISFDSGDLLHTGISEKLATLKNRTILCNIDHHPTNTFFGHYNLVEPEAVSTTEIIYRWYRHFGIRPEKRIAALLLAGILADTNNFSNYNTSKASLEIAAQLLKQGISLNQVAARVHQKKTPASMQAWGKILSRLKKNQPLGIASTIITMQDLEATDDPQIFQGIANFLNSIADAKVSMVIKETPDDVLRVSMRTNDDLIDVSKFAKMFNGGGHKKAAGFSVKGKLKESTEGWEIV